jgi:hypothetical protein
MFNFNVSIPERMVLALERIAVCLERAVPPIPEERLGFHKRGPEAVISYGDNEKAWKRETLGKMVHRKGLAPSQEQELLDDLMEVNEEDLPR